MHILENKHIAVPNINGLKDSKISAVHAANVMGQNEELKNKLKLNSKTEEGIFRTIKDYMTAGNILTRDGTDLANVFFCPVYNASSANTHIERATAGLASAGGLLGIMTSFLYMKEAFSKYQHYKSSIELADHMETMGRTLLDDTKIKEAKRIRSDAYKLRRQILGKISYAGSNFLVGATTATSGFMVLSHMGHMLSEAIEAHAHLSPALASFHTALIAMGYVSGAIITLEGIRETALDIRGILKKILKSMI